MTNFDSAFAYVVGMRALILERVRETIQSNPAPGMPTSRSPSAATLREIADRVEARMPEAAELVVAGFPGLNRSPSATPDVPVQLAGFSAHGGSFWIDVVDEKGELAVRVFGESRDVVADRAAWIMAACLERRERIRARPKPGPSTAPAPGG